MSFTADPPANDSAIATPFVITAELVAQDKIIVGEPKFQDELRTRGFGEKEISEYLLRPYEALYLIHTKRLALRRAKHRGTSENEDVGSAREKELDFDSLFKIVMKHDKNILTKFLIYRDLRSRGYVTKEGFGFGADFRVYDRGDFEKKPAKYVVFGINEGTKIKASRFSGTIEQIEKMGKEAVIAVIERRGEIIYYKACKMRFAVNRNNITII